MRRLVHLGPDGAAACASRSPVPGWEALVLVKPQFEAGREDVRRRAGSSATRRSTAACSQRWPEAALAWGAETLAVVDSGLPGPKGNREFFLHLVAARDASCAADLDRWIDDAVG